MHVLIAGCGRVGSGLARDLVTQGFDVAIIDESPEAFHLLGDDFPGEFVVGRALDWEVLREAGIERAVAFVACTDGDNTNIVIAQIAQKKYGIRCVVARVYDPLRATTQRMPYFFCAICAMTMLVLSPSVQATKATARSIPASRRTSQSRARPTTNSPGKSSPSRWKASGLSSMMATSKPCVTRSRARPEPTRPQPTISTCIGHLSLGRGRALASAFGGGRPGARGLLRSALGDRRTLARIALGHKIQQHLTRGVVEDVVGGTPEHEVADAAFTHGPEDDDFGTAGDGLFNDGLPGLPRSDHVRRELDLERIGDPCGRSQHPSRLLPLGRESRVERQVERHFDDV